MRYECMIWSIIVLLLTAQYHNTLGTVMGEGFDCRTGKIVPEDDSDGRWNRVSGKCHLQDFLTFFAQNVFLTSNTYLKVKNTLWTKRAHD